MDDVCFILEGTYPFVKGGVSSWTHQFIENMPDLKFSLLVLSPTLAPPQKYKYDLPDNVNNLVEGFLYNVNVTKRKRKDKKKVKEFWDCFFQYLTGDQSEYITAFKTIFPAMCDPKERAVDIYDIIYSRESHTLTEKLYKAKNANCSFFDFFWTWRSMLIVFTQVMNIEIPQAKVYHAACTGYAGLAGAVAKMKYNRPLILTEHGIYTKERKIEINQADWIQGKEQNRIFIDESQGDIKDLWLENFIRLGKLTYEYSDEIYTLYQGNEQLEIEYGADPEKIKIIPNGVDVDRFFPQRAVLKKRLETLNPTESTRIVGLVGRVVPIKDIKMFIKVCKIVTNVMPNVIFQVIGPTEEDEDYYRECLELVETLQVGNNCEFTGTKNLIEEQTYTTLDIMALTSISEGQPLTILEALVVGVPCVSTDVGACSELINGGTEEDQALGPCGYIAPIGNVEIYAAACIKILKDLPLQKTMIESGYQRIDKYYRQDDIINTYKNIYLKNIRKA